MRDGTAARAHHRLPVGSGPRSACTQSPYAEGARDACPLDGLEIVSSVDGCASPEGSYSRHAILSSPYSLAPSAGAIIGYMHFATAAFPFPE